ncbi:MAG: DUF484 family protein [Gammaproteobacteria bacterium]|jgi:hypothetical protein
MKNESGAAHQLPDAAAETVTADQVAAYLSENPDFFLAHQELLAELTLPHESGQAVSLLERQVSLLRERNYSTREQLGNLLENASKNDQFFEITRSLVLALLRADSADRMIESVRDTFLAQDAIDACELILDPRYNPDSAPGEAPSQELAVTFADVFRLNHTHCGKPSAEQLNCLFGDQGSLIRSTALCPIMHDDKTLGILAIASRKNHYFNVNLDTLFLDFIGSAIAAMLEGHLSR